MKKTIGVSILIGIILGFYIGRHDFSRIKNPFRNYILIRNEEEREQVVGDWLAEQELAHCDFDDDEDFFFYAEQKTGPISSKNFKIVCGYYLNIKIHEVTINYLGQWKTIYCDQRGTCLYGEREK